MCNEVIFLQLSLSRYPEIRGVVQMGTCIVDSLSMNSVASFRELLSFLTVR